MSFSKAAASGHAGSATAAVDDMAILEEGKKCAGVACSESEGVAGLNGTV